MIRTLLATTALAALMSNGVMAQDAAPATDAMAPATTEAPADPAMGTDAMGTDAMGTDATHSNVMADGEMHQSFDLATGYTSVDTDNLATRLIDQPVYSSAGDDAEEIGNVTDLVFTQDGKIAAVVIGVGGFLGIGEKAVAVDFSSLEFTVATDNTERWVLPTTADELNNAPDFTWEDDQPTDNMNGADGMTPADPAMNTTDTMAPADDNAMAPANDDAMAVDNAMSPIGENEYMREGYARIEYEALTADNLDGATVIGPDGEDIADVGDILLNENGEIDAMVVDFGGFLGLGQKQVAVGMDNLEFASNDSGDIVIYSDFTREQLEAQPEYNEDTYATDPTQRATDM